MNRAEIVALIEEHLPQLRDIAGDVPLEEKRLLDSFDYVTLIQVLEDSLGIRVEGMMDEDFRSKDAIVKFVEARYKMDRGSVG